MEGMTRARGVTGACAFSSAWAVRIEAKQAVASAWAGERGLEGACTFSLAWAVRVEAKQAVASAWAGERGLEVCARISRQAQAKAQLARAVRVMGGSSSAHPGAGLAEQAQDPRIACPCSPVDMVAVQPCCSHLPFFLLSFLFPILPPSYPLHLHSFTFLARFLSHYSHTNPLPLPSSAWLPARELLRLTPSTINVFISSSDSCSPLSRKPDTASLFGGHMCLPSPWCTRLVPHPTHFYFFEAICSVVF
ncbi:hypothetical protein B0H14DRAFT_3461818 [Mycena olivaceomarginata]|nr:hypothetical protein B0H14DRAFT_3461818 [Mycena olivaceomarginata]